MAVVYRRKVADLHEALQREDTRAQAMELIRELVDEITLLPGAACCGSTSKARWPASCAWLQTAESPSGGLTGFWGGWLRGEDLNL